VGSGQEKGEIMTRTGVRLLVGVGLLVSAGCASMADTPPSVDVSGTWGGTWVGNPPSRNGAVTMTLKQSGAEASGNMRVSGAIVTATGSSVGAYPATRSPCSTRRTCAPA
jgi:hypothetical protein